MSYKVTITNNETGEVEELTDIGCIVGAFGSDNGVHEVSMLHASAVVAAATLQKAKCAIESALKAHPPLSLAMALVGALEDSLMKTRESEKQNENTES